MPASPLSETSSKACAQTFVNVGIGGTSTRAGIIQLDLKSASDFSKAEIWKFTRLASSRRGGLKREDAIESLAHDQRDTIGSPGQIV